MSTRGVGLLLFSLLFLLPAEARRLEHFLVPLKMRYLDANWIVIYILRKDFVYERHFEELSRRYHERAAQEFGDSRLPVIESIGLSQGWIVDDLFPGEGLITDEDDRLMAEQLRGDEAPNVGDSSVLIADGSLGNIVGHLRVSVVSEGELDTGPRPTKSFFRERRFFLPLERRLAGSEFLEIFTNSGGIFTAEKFLHESGADVFFQGLPRERYTFSDSVLDLAWRDPSHPFPMATEMTEGVVGDYGELKNYGIHRKYRRRLGGLVQQLAKAGKLFLRGGGPIPISFDWPNGRRPLEFLPSFLDPRSVAKAPPDPFGMNFSYGVRLQRFFLETDGERRVAQFESMGMEKVARLLNPHRKAKPNQPPPETTLMWIPADRFLTVTDKYMRDRIDPKAYADITLEYDEDWPRLFRGRCGDNVFRFAQGESKITPP